VPAGATTGTEADDLAEAWAELRGAEAIGFVAEIQPETAKLMLDERDSLAAEIERQREKTETLRSFVESVPCSCRTCASPCRCRDECARCIALSSAAGASR
jgi:hypothetical protein